MFSWVKNIQEEEEPVAGSHKTSETEKKNNMHIQIEHGWLLGRYAFAKLKLLHSEWV